MATTPITISMSVCGEKKNITAMVHYTYTLPIKGMFERGGRKLEPDAPEELELHGVWFCGINLLHHMTDEQTAAITKLLLL